MSNQADGGCGRNKAFEFMCLCVGLCFLVDSLGDADGAGRADQAAEMAADALRAYYAGLTKAMA